MMMRSDEYDDDDDDDDDDDESDEYTLIFIFYRDIHTATVAGYQHR
jgi:hypothetical protein